MSKLEYIRKLEEMETDVKVIEAIDEEGSAILLSDPATRELCLALNDYLDHIDPHNADKQESVAFFYESIMDNFTFHRGSYLLSTWISQTEASELFENYTANDSEVWEELREAFSEVLE
ncbi:hypothetical protein [Haloarcula sp. K1]|uniref:hypothetical protein n=1 Tax=Haloarcula sp. K1 TaxID=1622207 RepID=UPI0007BB906C|nr:hypothetical protein [Haloarcula sp. K1]KZX46272.1 hypothetical protein AV929_15995 [Haloarcula sp. K1]